MKLQTEITAEQFWNQVQKLPGKDACWLWTGQKKDGYGIFNLRDESKKDHKRKVLASQRAWELENQKTFPQGKCACHTCDNPPCVRPSHIFPGTKRDNCLDMVAKGRHVKGEQSGQAKLRESQVRTIRSLLQFGIWAAEIARRMSLPMSTVDSILKGRTWAHLGPLKLKKRERGAGVRCQVVEGEPPMNCNLKAAVKVTHPTHEIFKCSRHGFDIALIAASGKASVRVQPAG